MHRMKTILVTGAAGFIGLHVARRVLERGDAVVGIDNLNDYYDVNLKLARLGELGKFARFRFARLDITDQQAVGALFRAEKIGRVVHLAAQVGVRHSITYPHLYTQSNIQGFAHILEACREAAVEHLVYASSSSVYGAGAVVPFSEHSNTDHPLNPYASTKKANELMAHAYSHAYGFPATGLRFFTVYGPWTRPDMALGIFTCAILDGTPLKVFNFGRMERDFIYIDDLVDAVEKVLDQAPARNAGRGEPTSSDAPHRIYNVGNRNPVELLRFIEILESALGRQAVKNLVPMPAGEVPVTCADITRLHSAIGFAPRISLQEGISRYVNWYRSYYKV